MAPKGVRALWLLLSVAFSIGCTRSPQEKFLLAVGEGRGEVPLPGGVLELESPIVLGPNANGLHIVGKSGDVVRARPGIELRAFIVCRDCKNVTISGFAIEGDPALRARPAEAPPADTELRQYFAGNGIIIEGGENVTVKDMSFKDLSGFAVLTAFDKKTTVENSQITDSGTRNGKGQNTGSGGLAFTDGSDDFTARNNTFKRLYGTGVWVYSTTRGERPQGGVIEGNQFENISRAVVLLSRAYRISIRKNAAKMIGFPADTVNTDLRPPAGVSTEGKVDSTTIVDNEFEQVNGRCFDLDSFHDSEVSANVCRNRGEADDYPNGGYGLVIDNTAADVRPAAINIHDNTFDGMRWGGVFVLGVGHKVVNNKMLRLNLLNCTPNSRDLACNPAADEPMLARAGVYLGLRAARADPAEEVLVEGNEITGTGMGAGNCVVYAPQVKQDLNTIRGNDCRN